MQERPRRPRERKGPRAGFRDPLVAFAASIVESLYFSLSEPAPAVKVDTSVLKFVLRE